MFLNMHLALAVVEFIKNTLGVNGFPGNAMFLVYSISLLL